MGLDDAERLQRWLELMAERRDPELEMEPGSRMWVAQLRMLRHDLDMLRQARERAEERES